jgi:hypothetical protein
MVWAVHFKKFLKVIDRLPRLVLEVALGSGNVLLIGVIDLLVVVSFISSSSNYDPLG